MDDTLLTVLGMVAPLVSLCVFEDVIMGLQRQEVGEPLPFIQAVRESNRPKPKNIRVQIIGIEW